ncbi:hypothetical protein P8C59_009118 [Phyllachora maydis]|uniref:Uncharacterized protein n=1 Tax=Phyllachora maydis TaxID=1825666 RepID=A0AAD9IBZ3_9PEZI|nr:hypothetical protein P8C59_009118 [Phyllachora maydis]
MARPWWVAVGGTFRAMHHTAGRSALRGARHQPSFRPVELADMTLKTAQLSTDLEESVVQFAVFEGEFSLLATQNPPDGYLLDYCLMLQDTLVTTSITKPDKLSSFHSN